MSSPRGRGELVTDAARGSSSPASDHGSAAPAEAPDRPEDLRSLLGTYIRRHWPRESAPAESGPGLPHPASRGAALRVLRLLPWCLAALFAISFAWDFGGQTLQIPGYGIALEGLLLTVSVSGLIGFLTNWLAITMLFHPRGRRPLLGQGVIPAQRDRVILRLAHAVSDQLINEEIIKEWIESSRVVPRYRSLALSVTHNVLADPDFRSDIKSIAGSYVESVLGSEMVREKVVDLALQKLEQYSQSGFAGLALKAYRLFQEDKLRRLVEDAAQDLPQSVDVMLDQIDALLDELPDRLEARSEEIEEWATRVILGFVRSIDIHAMVVENMRRYDEHRLEALIKNSSNDQLNYIKYLGGALGMIGGLVIFDKWLAIPALAAIFGGLALIDGLLYRLNESARGV